MVELKVVRNYLGEAGQELRAACCKFDSEHNIFHALTGTNAPLISLIATNNHQGPRIKLNN